MVRGTAGRSVRSIAGAIALGVGLAIAGCQSQTAVVRVATTTSVENSGLLAAILPAFERQSGLTVQVLAVGSGQALNLIKRGEVTIGLTHDPQAELSALDAGFISGYRKIMFNDFIVVGPASDPAGIRGVSDVGKAFYRIATEDAVFVSRGDTSGTYSREQELWTMALQRPTKSLLLETGQGMGATLRVASERGAYTLTDRATFEQFRSGLHLVSLYEGGPELLNTYSVFLRSTATGTELDAARSLADWLADGGGRALITGFLSNGQPVFRIWPTSTPRTRPTDLPPIELANAR